MLIIVLFVVGAAIAVAVTPGKSMKEALSISFHQSIRVLPVVLPAAFIAGFLAELLPKALVAGLLGEGSGWTGYLIAACAGAVLPTGPMVVLPLGAALLKADAGLAQILTLYFAWTLTNLQRLLIWEVPLVGASLASRRFAGGLIVMPIAIILANAIALALAE